MPYSRIITFSGFIVTLLVLALEMFSPATHPLMPAGNLLLLALLAAAVFSLTIFRSFWLDTVALFFTAFFVQRAVLLYFWPDQISYNEYLVITSNTMSEALLFTLLCVLAVQIGYLLAKVFFRGARQPLCCGDISTHIRFPGVNVPFRFMVSVAAKIFFGASLLALILYFHYGVGVTALPFDRAYAVVFRIAQIGQSTGFIFLLALFMLDRRDRVWKLALCAVIIMFGGGFLGASKAALITPIMSLIIACYLARGRVPKKFIRWGIVAFLVTIFVFLPLIMAVRMLLADWTVSGKVGTLVLDARDPIFQMSGRLGGLDWLAGFMIVGRESFPWWVSGYGDVIELVNTLVPGELIPIEDWVSVAYIIPHLTSGLSLGTLSGGGHGELLGGVGMAFVYYGFWGGPLFFVIWSAITTVVWNSRIHVLFKGLYLYFFVIILLVGGGFISTGKNLMEVIFVLTLITSFYVVLKNLKTIPHGRAARYETGTGY